MNSRLTYSRIQDHNSHQQTDSLYNPLRHILLHPQMVDRSSINEAMRNSRISHDYKSMNETHGIKQQILIPDQPLVPTHNLSKVQGKKFNVVNAEHKVVGPAISPQQLQRIKNQGMRESKIVYDYVQQQIELKPEPVKEVIIEEKKIKYQSPPIEKTKPQEKYKYNLFSVIDEPANKIKESGCGACTCPGNEFIAARNEPQSLKVLR